MRRERLVQNEVCVCCVPVAERVVYLGGGISFLREKDCKTAFGNIASESSPCSSLNSSNSLNERSLYSWERRPMKESQGTCGQEEE